MSVSKRPSQPSTTTSRKPTPLSVEQLEARTLCTIESLIDSLELLGATASAKSKTVQAAPANAAPTLAKSITALGGNTVRGTSTTLSVLGKDDKGEAQLTYAWQVTEAPASGRAVFSSNHSNAAKTTKVTFTAPGNYSLKVTVTDRGGLSVTSNLRMTVAQLQSGLTVTSDNKSIAANTSIATAAPNQQFSAKFVDQFGKALSTQPTINWSIESVPSGGKATLSASAGNATVTFSTVGAYKLKATSGANSVSFTVNVVQRLTRIDVTPGQGAVANGGSQQFTATSYDQFNGVMSAPIFWSASLGSISSAGLFTAPTSAGDVSVFAKSGSVTGTALIKVAAQAGLQNSSIADLVTTLYADGSISRPDVIQILRSAGTDGVVDSTELGDLRYIVTNASTYNMASYVQVLASNVVNSNAANLLYQGVAAGNLAAGSSASLLTLLVDKWFMGTDVPAVTGSGIAYRNAAGVLFSGTPSRFDELQGQLGDCYFIAALGAIADRNPSAVSNMFIDNGDGTFTVRFYTGKYSMFYATDGTISDGFASGIGTADYVTVNRQLPSYSNGTFAYSNYGRSLSSTTTPLWIALAEKAYAQWNETGKANRNGTNTYSAIEGGWMGVVNAQVLGTNSTDYYLSSTSAQTLINALSSGKAVTIGTHSQPNAGGLVGGHAYSVTGYDSTSQTFNLYNPWGMMQPSPLTWAQLQANCSMMVVTNTDSSPINGGGVNAAPSVRSPFTPDDAAPPVGFLVDKLESLLEDDLNQSFEIESHTQRFSVDSIETSDWHSLATDLALEQGLSRPSNELTPELIDQALDDIDALLREVLS